MLTCQFEDGNKFNFRHVTVTAIILNKTHDQILLAKRSDQVQDAARKYCMPGGYLDRNETLQSGLIRETLEETGYKTKIDRLFVVVDNPNRKESTDRQNVEFTFIVEAVEKIQRYDWETGEVKWFPTDKLPSAEEIAFDHKETLDLYLKYLKEPFMLPAFRSR